MSKNDCDLMYVNIPKNASSWTKPALQNLGWEFYNYHMDHLYHKHSIVVLRDPVERWLTGVCEYFTLYHRGIGLKDATKPFYDLLIDQVTLDDHTEKQIYFIDGLNPSKVTFFYCDKNYKYNLSNFITQQGYTNNFNDLKYIHTTEESPERKGFIEFFKPLLDNGVYVDKIKQHYKLDYQLINQVKFYGTTPNAR
jgi:hypothetical protein